MRSNTYFNVTAHNVWACIISSFSRFYIIIFEDLLVIPSVEETAVLPVYAGGKWLALEPSAGLGHRFSKPHPPAQQSS